MKKLAAILAIALAFAFANAQSIAQKMSENAKNAKSLYAEFTQERTLSLLEEKSVSEGFLASDENGFVRWQIDEPFRSAMICDGKNTTHFEYADGKWRKLNSASGFPIEKIVEEIRKLVSGDYSGKAYTPSEKDGVLILIPANETARKFVSQIIVTPSADFTHPQKIEVKNPNGDISIITMKKVVANPKNINDAFQTAPLKEYKPE